MASAMYEAPALVVLGTVLELTEGSCDTVFTSVTGQIDTFGVAGCS